MQASTQNQPTLISLRIELDPFPDDPRSLKFTMADDAGNTLPAPVTVPAARLEEDYDVLARIAAHTADPVGGLPFGGLDEARVIFEFDGHQDGRFAFRCTLAYPNGEGGYQAVTAGAEVSDASLDRLVAGLRQLLDAGQGAYDWSVAP